MPPWEKVKGICQPCRVLLCEDQPFDCNRANGSAHWTCQSCVAEGNPTSISAGRVKQLGTCSFPIKPTKAEKTAFIAFAAVYGKNARESDGGHLAAARSKAQELETSNTGNVLTESSEKVSRIVILRIGSKAAAELKEKVPESFSKTVSENSEWTSVVNRPPTPPESIMDIPDSVSASNKASPVKSSFPSSPATDKRPELAVVIPQRRESSEHNRKSLRDTVTVEDDDEISSAVTSTPRKRRRLHRGLKERNTVSLTNEGDISGPPAPVLRRTSSFQTDEEILAKFTRTAQRRDSEGTSGGQEALQSSDPSTPAPLAANPDIPMELDDISTPAQKITELAIPTTAISDHRPATPPHNAEIIVLDSSPVGEPERFLEPSASDPLEMKTLVTAEITDIAEVAEIAETAARAAPEEPAEIMDLDTPANAIEMTVQPTQNPVQHDEIPDVLGVSAHSPEIEEEKVVLSDEAKEAVQSKDEIQPRDLSEIAPEQTQRPSTAAETPPSPQALPRQEQHPMVQHQGSRFTDIVFQDSKIASNPVSPMDMRHNIEDALQPALKVAQETSQVFNRPSQRMSSQEPMSHGSPVPQKSAYAESPGLEKERSQSGSPGKRAFPTDYLEQMLDSSKRSRTGSQSSDAAYQNSFTPINNPSFGSFQTLSNQSTESKPKSQIKPKPKPRRRPKGPDPKDLRQLAPAPFGNEVTHMLAHNPREPEQHVWNASQPTGSAMNILAKQDMAGRSENQKSNYPFLNRNSHRRNTSSNEQAAPPSGGEIASTLHTPPTAPRNIIQSTGSPYQRLAVVANSQSPKTLPVEPQTIRHGFTHHLPSPAESEFNVRPDLPHNDIFNRYKNEQPLVFEAHPRPQDGTLRRHSTQVELSASHGPSAVMPNLNQPLPSQMIASGNYSSNTGIRRNDSGLSQVFSAPLTPTEAYQSPQQSRYTHLPPARPFQASQASPLGSRGPSRTASGDVSVGNTALRAYTERAEIHVYPPSADEEDFEIVSLGVYRGADSFVRQVLSTIPEYAARVAKLRIKLTWMPEGYKGRSLKMALDDQPRKELAFKYVMDKIADNFKVAGPESSCVLDVDVILKEVPK